MRFEQLKTLCERGATLQEIANDIGVSRQRVHQILGDMPELKKLREVRCGENKDTKGYEREQNLKRSAFRGMTAKEFYSDSLRSEQSFRLAMKKANSRRARQEFDIEWCDLDWPSNCPVLGIELDYFSVAGKRTENSVSFDRIDPSKGYVKGNVIVMSWRANRIKNDGNAEEHRMIADFLDNIK